MAISTETDYEAMYRQHYQEVLRFVRRRADAAQVDDIVVETFTIAWRKRRSLPEDVAPWLYATARNTMLNAHRGLRRRAALAVRIAGQPRDDSYDPAGAADARIDLGAAWRRLAARDQEVLSLVVWEGLTDAQAAVVLGCSPSSVRMRLSRARGRLRELLGPVAVVPSGQRVSR
ncbi:RNA polymerase sigma factor [Actinacidiphila yeochonensis]|uniref:RNA polymerase sigma factor n=1 Tax=Actinacidiphila yeochonensis TaxID=89050 RepID=UPI000563E6DC|nr:sigma-70 family RNA polymerase sigma factor [Actinacidiphila yeochonensis]